MEVTTHIAEGTRLVSSEDSNLCLLPVLPSVRRVGQKQASGNACGKPRTTLSKLPISSYLGTRLLPPSDPAEAFRQRLLRCPSKRPLPEFASYLFPFRWYSLAKILASLPMGD
jgi:hypothetical protein